MISIVEKDLREVRNERLRETSIPCQCMISDFWPIIIFGKVLGYFPFKIRKESPHISKLCPFLLIYSVCVYGFGYYSTITICNNMLDNYDGDDFESKVARVFIFSFNIFFLIVFPSLWFSGCTLVKYFQQWCRFQFHCNQWTGNSLDLSIRSKCLKLTFVLLIFVVILPVIQGYITGTLNVLYFCSSLLNGGIISFNFILFSISCMSLKSYFQHLRKRLLFTLQCSCSMSSDLLKNYRSLFYSIYQITASLGTSFHGPWIIVFCFFLSSFIISSFGCAMGLLSNFDGNITPFLTLSLVSLTGILFYCCFADLVPSEVSITV